MTSDWVRAVERRLRGTRQRDDAGLTLAEMVASIGVGTLVMAAVGTTLIQGVRITDGLDQRNERESQVRVAMDRITKQVRTIASPDGTTPAIISATGEELGFYAKLNTYDLTDPDVGTSEPLPSVVWLWTRDMADGRHELCQQVVQGTVTGTGVTYPDLRAQSSRTCQRVASGLSSSAPYPTFTYLRRIDTTLRTDGSTESTIPAAGGVVAEADYTNVQSVEFWLTYDAGARTDVPDVSTVARVSFFNKLGGT